MSDVRYTRDEAEDLMRDAVADAVADIRNELFLLVTGAPFGPAFLAIFDEAAERVRSR